MDPDHENFPYIVHVVNEGGLCLDGANWLTISSLQILVPYLLTWNRIEVIIEPAVGLTHGTRPSAVTMLTFNWFYFKVSEVSENWNTCWVIVQWLTRPSRCLSISSLCSDVGSSNTQDINTNMRHNHYSTNRDWGSLEGQEPCAFLVTCGLAHHNPSMSCMSINNVLHRVDTSPEVLPLVNP